MSSKKSNESMHRSFIGPDAGVGAILDSRLKAIDIGISNLKNDYEFLSSRMDIMNANINYLCSKIDNNDVAITDLKQSIIKLDSKFDNSFKSVTNQVSNTEKSIINLMTQISGTLRDVNRKIGKLSDSCDENTADIEVINRILINNKLS